MHEPSKRPETVLAIGGHSADMEFTCGAILEKYVQAGHRAVLLHCTPGEKGHPGKSPEDYERQKREEAMAAAETLGAEARFLDYKGNQFPHDETARHAIAQVIRDLRSTIILTHWKGDSHKDHRNAHLNTMDALSYDALSYAELPGFACRTSRIESIGCISPKTGKWTLRFSLQGRCGSSGFR